MVYNKVIKLLVVEDEDYDIRRIKNTLSLFADSIQIQDVVSSGPHALDLLRNNENHYDVVIMDYQIAGGLMGEELIRKIKEIIPALQIIVITKMTINITDFNFANRLMKAGAFWYCTKYPGDIEDFIYQPTDFILSIYNAYEKKLLEQDRNRSNRKLSKNIEDILLQKIIIGRSKQVEDLRSKIDKYAQNNANILISGGSGTGKELVAVNIHYKSQRRFENFVAINCGSLPQELIESELFGYEKGAFTGANSKKLGLFEVANHGTVFLDEIADLPLQAQVKLLRVIQEGEIEKIGRTDKIKVDVRIIAATNKNLAQEVVDKRFREDLYYRLNVVPINVPSLKDRPEDIPLLVDHFLNVFCSDLGKSKHSIDEKATEILQHYDWPGNVRELINVIQRLSIIAENVITASDVNNALISLPTLRFL
ncbi:MAG: sigma-54 dependent transcriptional regulator [Ignavibacteriaceae bacterium]|nr:sigma-54 dependent transcriptional regulator [Ignavibacteriaceae bacterium]